MYICVGLVLGFRHIFKPRNVAHNIFSELPQNASLLFFRKKINEICKWKILSDNGKLKPNFVENLQRQFSDFCNIKTILSRKTLCNIWNRKPNFVENLQRQFSTKNFAENWKPNQTLWINVALNFSVRENIILCATSVCFKWQG